ncbi:MAG: AEC family transporter [Caldilineaceae bacterium]
MRIVADALVPVFVLILLGYYLRHSTFTEGAFWRGMSRLAYFVLLPALLISRLARTELTWVVVLPMWSVVIITIAVATLGVWLLHRMRVLDKQAVSAVMQGSIRPNTYVGLALVTALYAQTGVAYAAVALAAMIPLANMISVVALVHYGRGGSVTLQQITRETFSNPLIIACGIGALLNVSGIGLLRDANNILGVLAQAALPVGLLTVGAGLNFARIHRSPRPLLLATLIKLLLSPLVALALCTWLGVEPRVAAVGVLFVALPCATSSYILAERMGGDFQLMAAILTMETLVAGITLPLLLLYL